MEEGGRVPEANNCGGGEEGRWTSGCPFCAMIKSWQARSSQNIKPAAAMEKAVLNFLTDGGGSGSSVEMMATSGSLCQICTPIIHVIDDFKGQFDHDVSFYTTVILVMLRERGVAPTHEGQLGGSSSTSSELQSRQLVLLNYEMRKKELTALQDSIRGESMAKNNVEFQEEGRRGGEEEVGREGSGLVHHRGGGGEGSDGDDDDDQGASTPQGRGGEIGGDVPVAVVASPESETPGGSSTKRESLRVGLGLGQYVSKIWENIKLLRRRLPAEEPDRPIKRVRDEAVADKEEEEEKEGDLGRRQGRAGGNNNTRPGSGVFLSGGIGRGGQVGDVVQGGMRESGGGGGDGGVEFENDVQEFREEEKGALEGQGSSQGEGGGVGTPSQMEVVEADERELLSLIGREGERDELLPTTEATSDNDDEEGSSSESIALSSSAQNGQDPPPPKPSGYWTWISTTETSSAAATATMEMQVSSGPVGTPPTDPTQCLYCERRSAAERFNRQHMACCHPLLHFSAQMPPGATPTLLQEAINSIFRKEKRICTTSKAHKYLCQLCGGRRKSAPSIRNHLLLKHLDEVVDRMKSLLSGSSSSSCSLPQAALEEQQQHRRLKCRFCRMTFKNQTGLKMHVARRHSRSQYTRAAREKNKL